MSFKESAINFAVKHAVKYARKDFDRNAPRILKLVEKADVKRVNRSTYTGLHKVMDDPNNNWMKFAKDRRKTNQPLTIEWEKPMQDIIDRYAAHTTQSPYLLPILTGQEADPYNRYKQIECRVNRNLKKIGIMAGINTALTTYVARHTWATVALHMNIPLSIISEGMGHRSYKTTQIYLNSIDLTTVNEANKMIISKILNKKKEAKSNRVRKEKEKEISEGKEISEWKEISEGKRNSERKVKGNSEEKEKINNKRKRKKKRKIRREKGKKSPQKKQNNIKPKQCFLVRR